jgi:hypothetical protein
VELLALTPGVTLLADAGYQGLTVSTQTAGAVLTPRPARRKNQIPIFPALAAAHEAERRAHASQQIRVEHGIGHLNNWRALSRHLGDASTWAPSCPRSPGWSPARNKTPPTGPAAPPTEGSPGRHYEVSDPPLTRSTTARRQPCTRS